MLNPKVDPFTLEIIKEGLISISDEMFITTARTSMSTIIYEVLDFAVGLTDAEGRLISQANGVTLFLGTLDFAVRGVLDKFGQNRIKPGDIYLVNDPYTKGTMIGGGTHLSDVTVIAPIFYENRLIAFAANMAHWTEIGGMSAGSWSTATQEIYQEGLQLPCLKLYEEGKVNQDVIDVIRVNVRLPDMTLGDMHAQVASMRVAEQRFHELCDKYGSTLVLRSIADWLDYTETMTRQELRKIPDGIYEAEDYIENDGISDLLIKVCVKVTVNDGFITCDFTGSHSKVLGPVNASRTGLNSAARVILKACDDTSIPVTDGTFKPLTVVCPDGTIFTAQRPSAISCYWETLSYATDLIWRALAPVLPNRLPSGHSLSICGTCVSGINPDTGELFIFSEPQAGGWGAGADKDGESGLMCSNDGETYVVPVEVCEQRYGVMVDQFALNITEGGAGKYRGGFGLIRDYRATSESIYYTGLFGRFNILPWGLNGGHEGSRNYLMFFHKDNQAGPYSHVAQYELKKGEVVRLHSGTGGGYGDPFERPVEKVQIDVKNGYVTLVQAEKDYGVILDPNTLAFIKFSRGRKL